jgi:hypothetical protein
MGNVVAERRLSTALADQARLTTRYEESIGTSGELSAYARLQAANLAVSNCDRLLRAGANDRAEVAERFAFAVLAGHGGPRQARREVARRVHGHLVEPVRGTVALLVSEAVTNAVIHGAPAVMGTVTVAGELSPDRLRLEVTNVGDPFEPVAALPPVSEPAGRGLFLIETLSRAWGQRHASGETSVWFEVAI